MPFALKSSKQDFVFERTEYVIRPNVDVLLHQVIEQDGVLILETVETDPNDPEALPQVCHFSFSSYPHSTYHDETSYRAQQSSPVLVTSPWTCPQTWTTLQSLRSWREKT